MKKHFKGMAVLLAAAMLNLTALTAYAGPADDIAAGIGPNLSEAAVGPGSGIGPVLDASQQPAQPPQQPAQPEGAGQPAQEVHVNVNYMHNNQGQLSALSMNLNNYGGIGGVSYRGYTNTGGFLWWYHDGIPTGVVGDGSYLQAIQIELTGHAKKAYDIYYCVTSSGHGRMGYACNGQLAGTKDLGESIQSVEVVLVPKGGAAPVSSAARYVTPNTSRLSVGEYSTTMTAPDGNGYQGWLAEDHVNYYFIDGKALTGWQYVDGYKYYFDSYGRLIQDVDALIGKQPSYLLRVNKTLNCLTVYAQDGANGYILPVKAMLTSVGDDTPIGSFRTPVKYRWRLMINDTYTQYATRITQGFLLHSITYDGPHADKLLTVGYNGLGVSRSHGCVRLTCGNSKWIYDNCALGTTVEIYEDPVKASPFDKPELVPVSDQQFWDPTDPLFQ